MRFNALPLVLACCVLGLCMILLGASAMAFGQEIHDQDCQTGQEQSMVAIRKLGGEVTVDSTLPGSPVTVVLTGSANPGRCLPYLKDLGNLHTCDL